MNFLYPGFLFALAAVLVPVVIHLFNFRKFKKVYFSNVAFLKTIQQQQSSQQKIKNLLILFSRILAIVFLVFAFARPFLSSLAQADFSKGNIVSIYLDNSYSMDAVNKEGSLLDEAKRRAKDIVKGYQLNDKFQLLTNDFEGKHQRLLNADEFLLALNDVKISSASRNLQQVLNRQQGVFTGNANRFSYILSDFQRGFVGNEAINTQPNTNVSLVKLNAAELPNIAIDSVWFLSPVHQAGAREKIIVRLKNYGKENAASVPLKLTINDQQKAISNVNVGAGKTVLDTLVYSGLSAGWQRGVLTIKDFPLTFDDELNFSFDIKANQQVLAINGTGSKSFLKTLYGADSYFKFTEFSEANINYQAIAKFNLVVLNELSEPSSGLAVALKAFVANGGTVAIFPNTATPLATYNSFLANLTLPAAQQLVNEPAKVSQIELKNKLFSDVFASLPKQIDLPQANKYFSYLPASKVNKEVILSLPASRFYLARFGLGDGQIFLSANGLNEQDGNFAKHPLFVPIMYKMAFESVVNNKTFYTIAKDDVITLPLIKIGANQALSIVGKSFDAIPALSQKNGKSFLYIADQIKQPGFYAVKKADTTLAVVAFNNNRTESNMLYDDNAKIAEVFGGNKAIHFVDAKTDNISSAIAEKNNGTELWKLCLILSLIFIAAEVLLVRFFNPTIKNKVHEPLN